MHNARTNGREKGDRKDFFKANCARKLISQQIQECQKLKIVREKKSQKEKYDARTKEQVKGRSKAEKAQVAITIRVDGK